MAQPATTEKPKRTRKPKAEPAPAAASAMTTPDLDAHRIKGTQLRDSKGIYSWKDEKFRSVTGLIKRLDKPALTKWASKSVAEWVAKFIVEAEEKRMPWPQIRAVLADVEKLKNVPWDYAEAKRDIGSTFHDVADAIIRGTPINPEVFASDVRPYVKSFLRWHAKWKPKYLAAECAVFSREHKYAGTTDGIIELGGRCLILDYKTSNDTHKEHSLQLAAYRFAEFVGIPETGEEIPLRGEHSPFPPIDGGVILVIKPDPGECELFEWPADQAAFKAFTSLVPIDNWQSERCSKVKVA